MRKSMKRAVALVPASLLLAMGVPASAFAVDGHSEDFETDTIGWIANGSTVKLIGDDGPIKASSGSSYLQVSGPGAFTKFAGFTDQWDGAWSTSTDVYLDPAWSDGTGFDYSVAANRSDGTHLRDYILHVAQDESTGKLLVAASNNTDKTVRSDLENYNGNREVTEAGWYTIRHSFFEQDGHLAVNVQLLDKSGNEVFGKILASDSDTMDKVGGNRYGWFTALEGTELAIDNVRVERVDAEASSTYSTNFDGVGITKDKTNRWHMSGGYDAAIVDESGDAMLRISNAKTTSGSFGDQLFSPELTLGATEAATNNTFNASFVIEPTEYQEGLELQVSPDDGHGGRDGFLRLKHEDGGLTIDVMHWFINDEGDIDYKYVRAAHRLDVTKQHTVSMQVIKKADDSAAANDVFRVSIDNGKALEGPTFEPYYDFGNQPDPATDTLLFRLKGTSKPDLEGKGFLIDDVAMSVSTTKPVTPPTKPVTPPTKPVTPPSKPVTPPTKPAAKPKASVNAAATKKKNKLYVNVNPNKGSGYWEFKIQKQTKDGWTTLPGTYKTHGKYETRTINKPKGTYRVVTLPKYGHDAGVSQAVHLKK